MRLHLAGFWWGDVSLSNTLFRRDAGAFAAYLVDAETGELHHALTRGQREHDLDIARVNIAGELMDLEAGGLLHESADPIETSNRIVTRYHDLWEELTGQERFEKGDRWRVDARIRRLNELGFDVDELAISTDVGGTHDPDPAQGRRRRPPLAAPAAAHRPRRRGEPGPPPAQRPRLLPRLARTDRARTRRSSPTTGWPRSTSRSRARSRVSYTAKLEPAEIFHEVLEHRWYMSEKAGHDVPIEDAITDYVETVLPGKPDEKAVLGVDTVEMPVVAMFGDELGSGPTTRNGGYAAWPPRGIPAVRRAVRRQ